MGESWRVEVSYDGMFWHPYRVGLTETAAAVDALYLNTRRGTELYRVVEYAGRPAGLMPAGQRNTNGSTDNGDADVRTLPDVHP